MKKTLKIISLILLIMVLNFTVLVNAIQVVEYKQIIIQTKDNKK